MLCEVCGKPVDVEGLRDIQEKYGDQIYRPGEDVDDFMTDDEMDERRREIAAMFESGQTEFHVNGDQ